MNDFEIYKNAALILRTGENVALVTVISTEGSTPGKVGYKMLVWGQKAHTLGTVGGGLAEAEVIDMAKSSLAKTENRQGLTAEHAETAEESRPGPALTESKLRSSASCADSAVKTFSFDGPANSEGARSAGTQRGICGGSMEVLVEIFNQKALPLFEDILAAIENGQKGALLSIISPKRAPKKVFLREQQVDTPANLDLPPEAVVSIRSVMDREQPERRTLQNGVEMFIEPVLEEPMVIIFGAGHLSYYICRLAKSVNFRVTVCDDRAEFANQGRFPDADSIVVESFETVFDRIDVTKNSYIVIVTRGHESDQTVLEKAVKTDAKYVGMIGSKKKTTTILKRLQEKGIPRETLRRVYSPIGISIGAVTPQEIALSIVCELTKIRRLGETPAPKHMKISARGGLQEVADAPKLWRRSEKQ